MAITQARMLKLVEAGESLMTVHRMLLQIVQDHIVSNGSAEDIFDAITAASLNKLEPEVVYTIRAERDHYERTRQHNAINRLRMEAARKGEPFKAPQTRRARMNPEAYPNDAAIPEASSSSMHLPRASRNARTHSDNYVPPSPEAEAAAKLLAPSPKADVLDALLGPGGKLPADIPPPGKISDFDLGFSESSDLDFDMEEPTGIAEYNPKRRS